MESNVSLILNGISQIDGYNRLTSEIKSLINHVITNFLLKKISGKVASKRISALFENEELVNEINTVFKAFSYQMPLNQYKEKYQQNIPRKIGNWTPSEDEKLLEAVHKFGTNNWTAISEYVGNGRTKAQCSQRWDRTLDPTISKEEWTPEETKKLIEGVKKFGTKSWVKISKFIGTRSDVQCRYRYNTAIIGRHKSDIYRGPSKPKRLPNIKIKDNENDEDVKEEDQNEKNDRFSFLDKIDFNDDMTNLPF